MKRFWISLAFLALSLTVIAQFTVNLNGISKKKLTGKSSSNMEVAVDKGETVFVERIDNVLKDGFYNYNIVFQKNGEDYTAYNLMSYDQFTFQEPTDIKDMWAYLTLRSKGFNEILQGHLDQRHELETKAIDFIQNLEKYNQFFNDAYLEDYMSQLLFRIHPSTLDDGRPGTINIKVAKDPEANSYCLPNGTIIINTGLLSILRSENEVLCVLAHEISHFVLDHHIVNLNKMLDAKARAEFWATLATVAAATYEGYLGMKYHVYTNGNLTRSVALLSTEVASQALENLGNKFSQEQEVEADRTALIIISKMGISPITYATMLSRIRDYDIKTGNFYAFTGKGTHPAIDRRIEMVGFPPKEENPDLSYFRKISLVTTTNAWLAYYSKRFTSCEELSNRNIEIGVATESDFLLKAMSMRMLYNSPESNQKALDYIAKAKELKLFPFVLINKEEALLLLRLNKKEQALNAINTYIDNLGKLKSDADNNDFAKDEIDWAKNMAFKIKSL